MSVAVGKINTNITNVSKAAYLRSAPSGNAKTFNSVISMKFFESNFNFQRFLKLMMK